MPKLWNEKYKASHGLVYVSHCGVVFERIYEEGERDGFSTFASITIIHTTEGI